MDEKYLKLRQRGINWIDKDKSFKSGLIILQESGFKPVAVGNVARRGEGNAFANEKLLALMYEFIRLWSKPELAIADDTEEIIKEDPENLAVNEIDKVCDKEQYPQIIRRAMHEFYAIMQQRRELHQKAAALSGNTDQENNDRNAILNKVERLSMRMDQLWNAIKKYEQDLIIPTELYSTNDKKDCTESNEYESLSIDDLKKLKKNTNTKLIRAKNMLDYGQVAKSPNLNPMPTGPKRAKQEKKIEQLIAEIEKIDYRIVELS